MWCYFSNETLGTSSQQNFASWRSQAATESPVHFVVISLIDRGQNNTCVLLSVETSKAMPVNREEQGWRSGESARLPPMWPGFDSRTRRHMWVEFVVGSHPCSERFFSGYSGFPLSSKTNISKFQFDPEPEGHRFVSPRLLGVTLVKQS